MLVGARVKQMQQKTEILEEHQWSLWETYKQDDFLFSSRSRDVCLQASRKSLKMTWNDFHPTVSISLSSPNLWLDWERLMSPSQLDRSWAFFSTQPRIKTQNWMVYFFAVNGLLSVYLWQESHSIYSELNGKNFQWGESFLKGWSGKKKMARQNCQMENNVCRWWIITIHKIKTENYSDTNIPYITHIQKHLKKKKKKKKETIGEFVPPAHTHKHPPPSPRPFSFGIKFKF